MSDKLSPALVQLAQAIGGLAGVESYHQINSWIIIKNLTTLGKEFNLVNWSERSACVGGDV